MKTLIIVLISLLVGGALGAFLALGFGRGMGTVTGLIYGSQVGVCVAAQTARDQGLAADPAALDRLIAAAVERIRSKTPATPDQTQIEWAASSVACRPLVEKLDQAPVPGDSAR